MGDIADPLTLARLAIKVLAYGASLLAAGLALFLAVHRVNAATDRHARRLAAAVAVTGIALAAATLSADALFLTGGDWAAAFDPLMLSVVLETPIGTAQLTRAGGLALVAAAAIDRRLGPLGAAGALIVAASFALVGHSLREPRELLGPLVALHVTVAAYWIGAFAPLAHAARTALPADAGRLAEAFGRVAIWTVGVLAAAGVALGLAFGGDPLSALQSEWGRALAVKLMLIGGLLTLAALNKMRLSPRLAAGDPAAAAGLRRSIAAEAVLASLVVMATAVMTATGAPAAP
jgi:putative copper resistance protein D